MRDAPLIMGVLEVAKLHDLRMIAAARPVDMLALMEVKTEAGKTRHIKQMTAQSVEIPGPWPFLVTFSIETGHPAGTCRHMSMSIQRKGRVPSPQAVWMVATELGFVGGYHLCSHWQEQLQGQGVAINLVQPVSLTDDGTEAKQ